MTTNDLINQATAAIRSGDYQSAIQLLKAGSKQVPIRPDLFVLLGEAYSAIGEHQTAAKNFRVAHSADPGNSQVAELLMLACYKAKDWSGVREAHKHTRWNDAKPGRSIKLLCLAAVSCHWLGEFDQSKELFKESQARALAARSHGDKRLSPEMFNLAMMASIGIPDLVMINRLMALLYPEFFARVRELRVSPVYDITAWCRALGLPVKEFLAPVQIDLRSSSDLREVLRYSTDTAWSATLHDAEIIPGWDFPITADGEVLRGANYADIESSYPFLPHIYYADLERMTHVWSPEPIVIDDDAIFLNCPETFHYGHWLVDFLPRLMAWRRPQKLAIPKTLPPKHREALSYFGVGSDDLLECEFAQRHRVRSLTIVRNGDYLRPNRERVEFVYNALCQNPHPLQPSQTGRRIFLMRNVGTRSIANQAEFEALLVQYGFEVIDVAPMTLHEQNELFANVSIALGVFGSDLLTLYHMRRRSHLIELIWDEAEDPIVIRTCKILGIQHYFAPCKVSAEPPRTKARIRQKFNRDVVVDCRCLRQLLDQIRSG